MVGDVLIAVFSGIGYNLKVILNQVKGQIVLRIENLILDFVNLFLELNLKSVFLRKE